MDQQLGFKGGHAEAYRLHLADRRDNLLRPLLMESGRIDFSMFREVPGGGEVLILSDPDVTWSNQRLVVEYVAQQGAEEIKYRLITGVVTGHQPDELTGLSRIEFLDKCVILLEDEVTESYGVAVNDLVVNRVRELIESTGETRHNIENSTERVRVARSWPAGTSKLTIINELLDSVSYSRIRATGGGVFVAQPLSSGIDPIYDFREDDQTVYSPQIDDERDLLSIPNQIICKSTTDGEEEPLVSVVQNQDPDNEWSIPRRGRVISRTIEDIEVTSQSVLDDIAIGYMSSSSQVTWRQTLRHLRLSLGIDDTVIGPNGQEAKIVEYGQELAPGALTETVIRRMDRVASTDLVVL